MCTFNVATIFFFGVIPTYGVLPYVVISPELASMLLVGYFIGITPNRLMWISLYGSGIEWSCNSASCYFLLEVLLYWSWVDNG